MSERTKVAVIGGGITGITTAYKLVTLGHDVTVFERHRYAAMETSFANGGQLSVSNAEVWNSWATILKGTKWIFTPGAPLLVNPKPSWHKLSWMAEFMRAIPNYEANTIETVRMALLARDHLLRIARDENIDFDIEYKGILHFYETKEEFDAATKVTGILAKGGLTRRAVTPEEVSKIEPSLLGIIYGGYYTDSDMTGDIHKFTNGLADACDKHGAVMRFERVVTGLDVTEDTVKIAHHSTVDPKDQTTEAFNKIVICAGVGSRGFAAQVGDRVNIYPVKGYSITVNLMDERDRKAAPWVSLLDDNAKIVTSRLGPDRFRVAGTAEFNGRNYDIRAARIDPLTTWCNRHFPDMSTRNVVPWAGLRPMMPNMLPKVGPGKNPRVLYNTGHGHLGWTLSAATAELLGEFA